MRHKGSPDRKRILVLVETETGWGRAVVRGAHAECVARLGWRLSVDARGARAVLEDPIPADVDGIIARVADSDSARVLARAHCPVVNVSATVVAGARFLRVATDVAEAGRMAARYFLERGFRSFAYLSYIAAEHVVRQRRAFASACREGGGACAHLACEERGSQAKAAAWLKRLPRPLAVLTWSRGAEVLDACVEAELAVPYDVAILSGSDDDLLCEVADVPISAIRQPAAEIGAKAVSELERLLSGKRRLTEEHWLSPLEIVTRRSTDTLAMRDAVLEAAVRFIRSSGAERPGVNRVARAAGVSRRVLERKFRLALGTSVGAVIRRERLANACRMLASTACSIAEIAESSGFASPEYFAHAFKSAEGVSPLRFRQRLLGRK